jgi:hypothetical protein
MMNDQDRYEAYYADKLWNLLPAVYRAQDTDAFGAAGPLRELVERIGAQAAVVRRSIDRLWEDQSIETCDDWVIPYIGDLLATNVTGNLDARGRRLDVAKTIHYRRRKGTPAILEEIAADITGWEARVVEFFRRLCRTRHGLDPALGLPPSQPSPAPGGGQRGGAVRLRLAEGLNGPLTGTGVGGLADLRSVYGASRADSAFDDLFHSADFRRGRGKVGWHNIPRLGVFLWRLRSYGVASTTPVPIAGCPAGWYTFDPTGRDIPLFAAASRTADSYGDQWVSPVEGQLPTPISQHLFDAQLPTPSSPAVESGTLSVSLYPESLGVFPSPAADAAALPPGQLKVLPERGRVHVLSSPASPAWVRYHYGFAAEIGAGPYDRRLGRAAPPTPTPSLNRSGGGPGALVGANALPPSGTVTLADSLTYTAAADVAVLGPLTVQAGPEQRPVQRPSPAGPSWTNWRFTGQAAATGAPPTALVLDGLLLSGIDLVLAGAFDSVTVTCCTLDPGSAAAAPASGISPPAAPFAVAADGAALIPCRLWVEGTVGALTVERCIVGPIRTRAGGLIETLTIRDSIVQALPSAGSGPFQAADVCDPAGLAKRLQTGIDAVSAYLRGLSSPPGPPQPTPQALAAYLNALLPGPSLYDPVRFRGAPLSPTTRRLLAQTTRPPGPAPALNRRLLEDAYPRELADAALALSDGDVCLSRCTVLGRVVVHRLTASECILRDFAEADDTQHGCVRFSAWADGSVLPRQYESVRMPEGAALFTSADFGRPGYCQLAPTADGLILPPAGAPPAAPPTILGGAEDGSEMGAFAREKNSIKERGLLLKLQEYMPAGLVPVLVYVT